MTPQSISLKSKLGLFSVRWSPLLIAELNDYQFKLAKLEGAFVWHQHADTDEAFFVVEGALRIEFRDGVVELAEGELCVVPRGVEHRPVAETPCSVLLIEPRGVVNTGEAGGAYTAPNDVWI